MQEAIIIKRLSIKSTNEYFGMYVVPYNPVFNYTEFGTIKNYPVRDFISVANTKPLSIRRI